LAFPTSHKHKIFGLSARDYPEPAELPNCLPQFRVKYSLRLIGKRDIEKANLTLPLESIYSGKTILLTGACGCIGSAITKALLKYDPQLLILLDRSELHLYQMQLDLAAAPNAAPCSSILGDVCNGALIDELLARHRPDYIFHSAAFKHAPLLESNPFEAVRNNIIGTAVLTTAAVEHRIGKTITISTDKAANPQSVLGVSKRVAELVSLRWNSPTSQMSAIRLANVLGSPGSVVPLFLQQIAHRGPVTVTHPGASRYFMTLGDTVELVLAVPQEKGGEVFAPRLGDSVKIVDLARHLIREAGLEPEKDMPITFTGLRPGDKMKEEFASTGESITPTSDPRLCRIAPSRAIPVEFDALIAELTECESRRDLPALLEVLCRLVPEYRPSETLAGSLNQARK
jgi:FlaA1/EpsC-like NDP-sugar epimerase